MARYKDKLTLNQQIRLQRAITDTNIKCKCGHTMQLPPKIDQMICNWCGNYVFRTPKDEFVYRLKEKLTQEKRKKSNLENK